MLAVVIKDEKAMIFNTPMFFSSLPEVIRSLTSLIRQQPNSMLAQFPADYSIWSIGEWDQGTGEMSLLVDKEHLFNMVNIVEKEKVKQ